jgi:hypothetical protein
MQNWLAYSKEGAWGGTVPLRGPEAREDSRPTSERKDHAHCLSIERVQVTHPQLLIAEAPQFVRHRSKNLI